MVLDFVLFSYLEWTILIQFCIQEMDCHFI